ncbi:hypothetical protein SAMN05421821_11134 [Mucilaginibacter lappiensis]|uniref:PH domain-containing protein n=1 Tax=Mucilaginibacter lappiensis TaxID=354630 RepID=A0ABR6PPU8_9SPHI|nr:hypothetical protein [Mucilaginibacter lappiensis]MBB6111224.1 hypothetical protein [Mucilaginibacter lappiensis]SIR73335.1 hypothetical protein SAMN05421821_11134 [Mucilaginibacter lappiensis]
MELPYQGRAIIEDNFDSVRIIIPSKKNYFIILFMCAWLCGWFLGETLAIREILSSTNKGADLFMIFWLAGWTIGGLFALKTIYWQLLGKECIEIGKGVLIMKRQGDPLSKTTFYDLNSCDSFRVKDDQTNIGSGRYNTLKSLNGRTGTIAFDYGMKTIRFGESIDEAEGKYLLTLLTKKKILTDKNLA